MYTFSDHEPPPAMLKLNAIADKEDGWIQVVSSMVNVIPMHNPLGPSVIILLLDDCPLPSKVKIYLLYYKNQSSQTAVIKIIVCLYDRTLCYDYHTCFNYLKDLGKYKLQQHSNAIYVSYLVASQRNLLVLVV